MFYLVYSYVVERYYHVDKKGGNLRPLRMKFKTYKQNLRPFQGLKFRFSNLRLFQVFKTPRVPCPPLARLIENNLTAFWLNSKLVRPLVTKLTLI